MSTRLRTCIGLAAVALATVVIGLSVWRGTALAPGEMVLGAVLLSSWVLSPTLFHFDGLRSRRFSADGTARMIAIVVASASAAAWAIYLQSAWWPLSPSFGFVCAPLIVLAAGWLTHVALRGERLSPAPPPAGW